MTKIFSEIGEKEITRTIVKMFGETIADYADSDVIIIGAGPSGLTAGMELAKFGVKTLIVEQNNYLGGGYWVGGYMMNPVTVRAPAQKIWDELGVPYRKVNEGLYATWGPHACSKLYCRLRAMQASDFCNYQSLMTLVLKNGRVSGVVINWMPVSALPRNVTCVDPIALESKIVIDASGHDSVAVKRLMDRGYIKWKGMEPMWVNGGEDLVVERTGEVFPGLIISGMSVTETHGLARMGPTFGSMLLSGKKAAQIAVEKLRDISAKPELEVSPPDL